LTLTPEGVKDYLDTEDGKKLLQPILDKYHAKSLESWKQNNLDKLTQEAIDKAISEKYPEETEEQKRLKRVEQELADERKARTREALRNQAITKATEKGLPLDIIDHFLGDDEGSTLLNLDKLETAWRRDIEKTVEGKFKEGGRKPERTDDAPKTFTREQVAAMSDADVKKNLPEIEKAMENW